MIINSSLLYYFVFLFSSYCRIHFHYLPIYIHTYICVCVCVCVFKVYIYACMCVYMFQVYICMHVCMRMYVQNAPPEGLSTLVKKLTAATRVMQSSSYELSTLVSGKQNVNKRNNTDIGIIVKVFANGPGAPLQSQVDSYQRLKKWYLMLPCLTLSIIR